VLQFAVETLGSSIAGIGDDNFTGRDRKAARVAELPIPTADRPPTADRSIRVQRDHAAVAGVKPNLSNLSTFSPEQFTIFTTLGASFRAGICKGLRMNNSASAFFMALASSRE